MDRRRSSQARAAAYRRARSRGRYAGARRGAEPAGISRLFLVVAVLALAVGLRLTSGGRLEILKTGMAEVLDGGGGVKEAVAVLGRALVGAENSENSREENAIVTFGKKFLGIGGEDKPMQKNESPQDAQLPDGNEHTELAPDEQGQTAAAGDSPGLSADRLVFPEVAESPMPEGITASNLYFELPIEEMEDDTPNEAFEIPSPDKVDDAKYTLGFSYQRPLNGGRITSRFGYRIHPIHGNTTFHYGVDLGAAQGTPVYSFSAGTIAETGFHSVYGNYVLVSHADGFATFYAHLSKIYVKQGAKVKMGQKIAAVGNTGWSTGPHLHFEIRRNGKVLDPFDYLSFE